MISNIQIYPAESSVQREQYPRLQPVGDGDNRLCARQPDWGIRAVQPGGGWWEYLHAR